MLDTMVAQRARELQERYEAFRTQKLDLDMTRGKPSPEQLKLSERMLRFRRVHSRSGVDCRNYGPLEGLPEACELFARYLGTSLRQTWVLDNSSLRLMHDVFLQLKLRGWPEGAKFICPVPGYDRHFAICNRYGVQMVSVPLGEDGPDMAIVEELVKDPKVVGMWCMPKYSNPSGITYSTAVARRLASMKTAYPCFSIFWDNAYAHHDLYDVHARVPDIVKLAREAGTEDRVWIFGSFSKVTHASAGLAALSSSEHNLRWFRESLSVQTIGPDKLTQLRHVLFLKNMGGVRALMRKHRTIIRPKFKVVDEELTKALGGKGVAEWSRPDGGYFISLMLTWGSAKRVVDLAKDVGLKLTPAGAAFPYALDPNDKHLRIAPTYPSLKQVRLAARVLALCCEMAHREAHPQTMKR